MAGQINTVILSGRVESVKTMYTVSDKIYVTFLLLQSSFSMKNGRVVGRHYDHYLCKIFDNKIISKGLIRDGVNAVIEGKLNPFFYEDKRQAISINVVKIEVYAKSGDTETED